VASSILYELKNRNFASDIGAAGEFRYCDEGQAMTTTGGRHWTFLSNHGHVLVCLALDPHTRLRDVAARVGITERAVQKIVGDLEEAGVLVRERSGRRNSYHLNANVPLRHTLEAHRTVGALLGLLVGPGPRPSRPG
jgi:predicted transcriptional regulator